METKMEIIIYLFILFLFLFLFRIAKNDSVYRHSQEERNPMEGKRVAFTFDSNDKVNADGVRGRLSVVGESKPCTNIYDKYIKRILDFTLSSIGLVVLLPVFIVIVVAIKIEDPGPAFFVQKRVGRNKEFFKLHKFRSMKVSTPHDTPTHMLEDPDKYITKVGKFIRAHSLDELPQIWDILLGNLSVVGPRPGLWNQDLLIAERDKYGANDIKPGLTGWAQINGRDELTIETKAELDGEYVRKESFLFDIRCFFGTFKKVLNDTSIIEGNKANLNCIQDTNTYPIRAKKILITGANSYIGKSTKEYLEKISKDYYSIDTLGTRDLEPSSELFNSYDVVFNVAGIAHIKETSENRQEYYKINRDLAIKIAKAAKAAGVHHFILTSTMSVYGKTTGVIGKKTIENPQSIYGKSKLEADIEIMKMADENFKVAIIRPPMVYGLNCKGNYQKLRKAILKIPFFPNCKNQRSMIYIGNLCEFVKRVVDSEAEGVFLPQNSLYINTSEMARLIAMSNKKKMVEIRGFGVLLKILPFNLTKKIFGDLIYEKTDVVSKYGFQESIELTEESIKGK